MKDNDYTFRELLAVWRRYSFSPKSCLTPFDGSLNPINLIKSIKYKFNTYKENPYYFKPSGLISFHGPQGSGKTLTGAAVYAHQLMEHYPYCIVCTNIELKDRPFNAYVYHEKQTEEAHKKAYEEVLEERRETFYAAILNKLEKDFLKIDYPEFTLEEYIKLNIVNHPFNPIDDFEAFKQEQEYQIRDILTDEVITQDSLLAGKFKNVTIQYTGIDCLKYINNGFLGVMHVIDEFQLELSSLESKNISMDILIEVSQLRKQRKHIIVTSQRLTRLAKPVREQLKDIVVCRCFFECIQYNQYTTGDHLYEDNNGRVDYDVLKRMIFFHRPEFYEYYDTYAKMRRYNNEWQGRPQIPIDFEVINHE